MTRLIASAFAVLLLVVPAPSHAGELAGVSMADSLSAGGHSMQLQGLGLRTKFRFKVYVGGLYLEQPTGDAGAVVGATSGKAIRLHMLRALDSEKVGASIEAGFQANSAGQMDALRSRLDQLKAMFPSVKSGDVVTLAYIPGKGTVVSAGSRELGVIEGADFAEALFKVWFGSNPVQDDLKSGMLGK